MAIFETGASTGVADMLDKICVFAAANGWTVNSNVVEGSGRRAHLQLGTDTFINLRALVAEYAQGSSSFGGLVSGIALNGSTANSGGTAWFDKTGAPHDGAGTPTYKMAGAMNIGGGISSYYLFARGSMIFCVLEYTTGNWQWLAFGKITKYGSWAGGIFFGASNEGHSNSLAVRESFAGSAPFTTANVTGNPNAYLYGTVDGVTGWMPCSAQTMNVATPKFFDTITKQASIFVNAANQFNGLPILLPVDICVTRDGTGAWAAASNFSIEGKLPDVYACNLRALVPGQQLDDGSGNIFRVFPFAQKINTGIPAAGISGWFGFAIKQN